MQRVQHRVVWLVRLIIEGIGRFDTCSRTNGHSFNWLLFPSLLSIRIRRNVFFMYLLNLLLFSYFRIRFVVWRVFFILTLDFTDAPVLNNAHVRW